MMTVARLPYRGYRWQVPCWGPVVIELTGYTGHLPAATPAILWPCWWYDGYAGEWRVHSLRWCTRWLYDLLS